MRFETDFQVPGSPSEVIRLFSDVPLMATFLPGASVGEQSADGSYPGTLTVSFGPKRISFKGTVLNSVEADSCRGTATGQGNSDVRGAKLAVTMKYQLSPVENSPAAATKVALVSEAQLSGLLAEFASTGGVALTNAILAEFTRRFAEHVGLKNGEPAKAETNEHQTLSGFYLLRQMVKSIFTNIFRRG